MIGITKLPRLLILISWIHISRQYNYIHDGRSKKIENFKISSEKFPFAWEVKQRVLSAPLSFRTLYKFIANFFLVPCTSKPWNLLKLSSPTWGRGGEENHAHQSFLLRNLLTISSPLPPPPPSFLLFHVFSIIRGNFYGSFSGERGGLNVAETWL